MASHTVRVVPQEIELIVDDGETVMGSAERLGWQWPTICHGQCECTVCWIEILDGVTNVGPMTDDEREMLQDFPLRRPGKEVRLACQTRVHGPVVVKKRGVTRA
jgi:ferredoxin, 2Fe-2S